MNYVEVMLVILAAGAAGALAGAIAGRRRGRGAGDFASPREARAAERRLNDMQGWRYGTWHEGRTAPLPQGNCIFNQPVNGASNHGSNRL